MEKSYKLPFVPGRNSHVGQDVGVLGGELLPLVDGVVLVDASEALVLKQMVRTLDLVIKSSLGSVRVTRV